MPFDMLMYLVYSVEDIDSSVHSARYTRPVKRGNNTMQVTETEARELRTLITSLRDDARGLIAQADSLEALLEEAEVIEDPAEPPPKPEGPPAELHHCISEMHISTRAHTCLLEGARCWYVGDLVSMTDTDLLKVKNLGRKILKELQEEAFRYCQEKMGIGDLSPRKWLAIRGEKLWQDGLPAHLQGIEL